MPMSHVTSPLRVVIVGGGLSGASLAWHLAQMQVPVVVTVIEPRAELGRGLAYSTTEPTHRINVPAHRMSLDPDHHDDFADWLREAAASGRLPPDDQADAGRGDLFPRREVFGQYVADRLAPHLQAGAVRHLRARVQDIQRNEDGSLLLHLSDDGLVRADLLVLATGHPPPAVPKVLAGLSGQGPLVADPYDPAQLALVPNDARVLIMGAALTSADVIATLDRQGFQGQITCISRHGLRSRGHGEVIRESEVDFTDPPLQGASDLLRRVRHAIVDDLAQGQGWQATIQRVRDQGGAIWTALDGAARRRLLRHLRTYWDVHRFRIAPQVEAVLDRLIGAGRLRYLAGHLTSAMPQADGSVQVAWRLRGTRQIQRQPFDRVIVTTGPAHDRCIDGNPALSALARLGLIAPDPLGLGLDTTLRGWARDPKGRDSDRVLIAGPLARGQVGELVGAPECSVHSLHLAQEIALHATFGPTAPSIEHARAVGQD